MLGSMAIATDIKKMKNKKEETFNDDETKNEDMDKNSCNKLKLFILPPFL